MKKCFLFVVILIGYGAGFAQQLSYAVSFPNLVHHEAIISLTVTGAEANNAMFRMSRSSPGRYATHEFAKNVYNVTATDKAGKSLVINQLDGDVFQVAGQHDHIQLTYTLFGNYGDGTYADIDDQAVLLNIPASFMWLKGAEELPIAIRFNLPANKHWTIATQLKPANDSLSFTAPNLQYFMDCPVLIGELLWSQWDLTNPDGKSYHFRLALHADATEEQLQTFTSKLKRLVREVQAVFKETPAYDYGTYTFLASFNPYVKGDGMEHRNSTMITHPGLFVASDRQLSTFAHEFFHCWNVERIRPASLEPFNFEKSNMSEALWFAEGFTQYYGELLMKRAGFSDANNFAANMNLWINARSNTPAGKNYSPIEMSRKAVFTDAGISIDKNNYANNSVSYYLYGAAIALALDLELRTKTKLTLDDVMVAAWKTFGKTGQPYTLEGLQNILVQVTNDRSFASNFFSNYVYGHQPFDYNSSLQKAGYQLQKVNANAAWLGGVDFMESMSGLMVNSNTIIGTPLYQAGVDIGDQIISINDVPVRSARSVTKVLEPYKPGDTVSLVFRHRDETKTVQIVLAENPALVVVANEQLNVTVTDEMKKVRAQWLNSKLN